MSGQFADIGVPEKISVCKDFQHLRIIRKWFGYKFLLLTLFVAVWDGFLLFWYSMALSSPLDSPFALLPLLFPIIHVTFGVGLTYYVMTGYLNQTRIDVDANWLTVQHEPLPFWGNRQISSRAVAQLYCKEDDWPSGRSYYRTFALRVITQDRRNIKLLTGLDNSEQALFIEQEIEKFLGIQDVPVKGEIR